MLKNLIRRATRSRRARITSIAAVLLLASASAALAYYEIVYSGASGSGSEHAAATGGTPASAQAATFTVSWPDNDLAPGGTDPLTIDATDNDPSASVSVNSPITATVTTSDPSCLPSWFTINAPPSWASGNAFNVAEGDVDTELTAMDSGASISFNDLPTVDQSSCEGALITVTINAASAS